MILIRFFLIGLIVYLIFRSFSNSVEQPASGPSQQKNDPKTPVKKVSKEIGEYVDYEEIKK